MNSKLDKLSLSFLLSESTELTGPAIADEKTSSGAPVQPAANELKSPGDSGSAQRYQCTTCQKRFAVKAKMLYHSLSHGQHGKIHVCHECEMAFGKGCALRNHIKCVHERERPYACEQCGQSFFFRKDLPKHIMSVHQGLRPFQCNRCGKSFGMKEHMLRHLRMVHEITTSTLSSGPLTD